MARGPAYPYVSLENAIVLTKKMYDYTKRSPAALDSILMHAWRYSPTSSTSVKVIAALKYFGLIDEVASKDAAVKNIKISDRAYRILIDTSDSPDRRKAIQEAALSPRWYKFCWDKWGSDMPSSMRSTLLFEHHFVDSTVDAFLRDYKRSMDFAGMSSVQIVEDIGGESANQLQGRQDGGRELQSNALNSALIADSVVTLDDEKEAKNDSGNSDQRPKTPRKEPGMRQEISSLTEGDVTITWPATISLDSYQDLIDWMELLKRKIRRTVDDGSLKNSINTNVDAD